ncbi:unnamed protein product [Cuscuta epithymum]|uniref:C2 NT-type domain-containing protein n=1 Tax=Cuscuta epithymum TaxID=186058 RepID=A0AAV0EDG9_9ASTE|nr:unnamed protein product [Cuscuta epithymum]
MVGMMKKWRPWPPLSSKKFEAKIVVHCVKGPRISLESAEKLAVEINWKGSAKINPLSSLKRRSERRNLTKEESLRERDDDGVAVRWDEEFLCVCNFSGHRGSGFLPWEVAFTLFNGLGMGPSAKMPAIATASLNLAEYVSFAKEKDIKITIPLEVSSPQCISNRPVLCLSLNLMELKNNNETVQKANTSPTRGEILQDGKNPAASPLRAGLEKVKFFTGLAPRDHKKVGHEEEGSPVRSESTEYNYPFDMDSFGDSEEGGESEEGIRVDTNFNYEALAYVNHVGGSYYSNTSGSEDEDWIYFSNRESDTTIRRSVVDDSLGRGSKRRILPWGKRRLSFRSAKSKGEPLLKKHYGEEGGDDIDFDRRQLSSSDESSSPTHRNTEKDSNENQSPISEFGDDNFAVGSWESKEIISRDGQMKLKTDVFFASIDQRDEQAAGESACAALVAVIADWFHSSPKDMPVKSQLDTLIREGSLEWRKMCEEESYRERFPDKHFDLETVLQAEVRQLSIFPEKSFVGFFHPEGMEDEGFDFLKGAMSFDSIWDEVEKGGAEDSLVYIVSWNDHFFVLKVEKDAYYIIDTLGERLYEGCNKAFILKFDRDTTISRLTEPPPDKAVDSEKREEESDSRKQETVVCTGNEACKEYIKSFLAAIPIRELQVDVKKKGLMASTLLHQRLQIEFHYTKSVDRLMVLPSVEELTANHNANNNPSEAQPVLAE